MEFKEILNDLMIEMDLDIQKLSNLTGIDDSLFYNYNQGSMPNVKNAVIIANFFNCSLNFLMGLDNEPNQIKFKHTYDISLFSNRYDELLKKFNVSHFRLCKETRLNYSSHDAWRKGAIPTLISLIIIANYFNTSIDYFIGRSDYLF